ncbi:MAG: transglutaminase domain-containing protein, partial [Bacteroidales bacterium]|nr:transglutaminase domain-containing protein [Bacteroidales bacterium]
MAKMKRSEIILWVMVAVALAANIWLPRHLRPQYSWERDLSQRIAANLIRPKAIDLTPGATKVMPEPARIRVKYSITVPAYTLRSGDSLRCWLPLPKGAELVEAGVNGVAFPDDRIILSPPSHPHGSVFMEARSSRHRDMAFYEIYEYSLPEEVTLNEVKGPEGRIEESYPEAAEIARWIRDSVRLAPMKEYSTIEDIPGQVASEKKGDDGGKALLFISMCKDKGIPVRWRSGLEPAGGKVFLREWAEISLDGQEWTPVPLSGGKATNP